MKLSRFIPELVRRLPDRSIVLSYRVFSRDPVATDSSELHTALNQIGFHAEPSTEGSWTVSMPWRTLVYGLIGREVDERVTVAATPLHDGAVLECRCVPVETHNAHAAGAGGAIAAGVTTWVVGGLLAGAAPGVTVATAGLLIADSARTIALANLERQLGRLITEIGSALWPGIPNRIHVASRPTDDRSPEP